MNRLMGYLVFLMAIAAVQADTNLIVNGDFQDGLTGWYRDSTQTASVWRTENPRYSGNHIMYLENGEGGKAYLYTALFEVPTDVSFAYSFDSGIWQETTAELHPIFQVMFYSHDDGTFDSWLGQQFIPIDRIFGDWNDVTTHNSGVITPPAGTRWMDVRFNVGEHNNWQGGVRIDNIRLLPVYTTAWSPQPKDEAQAVGQSPDGQTVTVDLSWNTGMDPTDLTTYNSNITTHYLYRSEANGSALDLVETIAADGPVGQATLAGLAFESQYLWRIDQGVDGSAPDAPETLEGAVWSFSTALSRPTISVQPVSVLANAGQEVTFTVEAESLFPVVYQWYKDDEPIASPSEEGTLTLGDVQAADEGYYYCDVANEHGVEYSDVVTLGVRRKIAHWTLDAADYAGGQYEDISGEENHADVGGTPLFVDGIVTGDKNPNNLHSSGAVEIRETDGWAQAGTWNPSTFSNQFTYSLWFKWNPQDQQIWNVFVAKRDSWSIDDMMYMVAIHTPSKGFLMKTEGGGWIGSPANVIAENQWHHLVAVYAGGPAYLYLDGEPVAQVSEFVPGNKEDSTFWIGRNEHVSERFEGVLDDLQVFNYALGHTDVIDLYYQETGAYFCLPELRPSADLTGNCFVGLEDFAILAAEWIESDRY